MPLLTLTNPYSEVLKDLAFKDREILRQLTDGSSDVFFNVVRLGNGTAAAPSLTFNSDTDTGIYRAAANQMGFSVNGAVEMTLDATNLLPGANDGNALGSATVSWADLYLASTGIINWGNGDVLITHSLNTLAFTGATTYRFDAPIRWTAGVAITAAQYEICQDADATNQLHFNVPTGAGFEFSVNDVAGLVLNSSGAISTGTWSATTIAVNVGGTGQTSYTNGQLLIGNTTGNTLAKATLTGTANQITITNGNGTITLSTPQDIATSSTPTFAAINLGDTNLSDYKEATFTPTVTLSGGAGNTVPVYLTNSGRYTRIGRILNVDILLTGDGGAEGAGTGQVNIDLPIAASASHGTGVSVAGFADSTTSYILAGQIGASATTISLEYYNTITTRASFTGNDQSSTGRTIRIKFFYEV